MYYTDVFVLTHSDTDPDTLLGDTPLYTVPTTEIHTRILTRHNPTTHSFLYVYTDLYRHKDILSLHRPIPYTYMYPMYTHPYIHTDPNTP